MVKNGKIGRKKRIKNYLEYWAISFVGVECDFSETKHFCLGFLDWLNSPPPPPPSLASSSLLVVYFRSTELKMGSRATRQRSNVLGLCAFDFDILLLVLLFLLLSPSLQVPSISRQLNALGSTIFPSPIIDLSILGGVAQQFLLDFCLVLLLDIKLSKSFAVSDGVNLQFSQFFFAIIN